MSLSAPALPAWAEWRASAPYTGYVPDQLVEAHEVLAENRFLAARDGMDAELIDPVAERRVPARELLGELLEAARPHAAALGCGDELDRVETLAAVPGAVRQVNAARQADRLRGLVATLAEQFAR